MEKDQKHKIKQKAENDMTRNKGGRQKKQKKNIITKSG